MNTSRLTPIMTGLGVLSACGFAAIAIVVSLDVLIRNLDVARISWFSELSEYLLMASTFLGAPWLLHKYGHVEVDILPRYLSQRSASRLEVLANSLGLVITGLVFWRTALVLLDTAQRGSQVYKNLIFPEWYLMVPLLLCMFFCVLEFALRLTQGGRTR
jgi:TRAP-type C4-dicarboxylate transport system permease small subunit